MSLSAFTLFHVVVSLIAMAAGFVVVFAMSSGRVPRAWTALFLFMTALTCVTGYLFSATQILPSHIVGALTLVLVTAASLALYPYNLIGPWRWIYVTSAVIALYFNIFVGIVQAFLKIPFLNALAPTQAEPPFVISHVVVLLMFVVLGVLALRSFHPSGGAATLRSLSPQRN